MISLHCDFHFLSFWNDMEWRNEEEWRGFRRVRKIWSLRCLSFRHHSVILSSFRNSQTNLAIDCPWNDVRMTRNDNKRHRLILSFRPHFYHSSVIQPWNGVWMKESGAVSYKRQHLILSFRPHFYHSSVIQPWNGVWMKDHSDPISIIPLPFRLGMGSEWKNKGIRDIAWFFHSDPISIIFLSFSHGMIIPLSFWPCESCIARHGMFF